MAIGSNGYAYVTDTTRALVSVIDTSTGDVATIPVESPTLGVVVSSDGGHVYVTHQYTGKVSVIDTATNAVETISVGGQPRGLAVSPDGSRIYVADHGGGVSVISIVAAPIV